MRLHAMSKAQNGLPKNWRESVICFLSGARRLDAATDSRVRRKFKRKKKKESKIFEVPRGAKNLFRVTFRSFASPGAAGGKGDVNTSRLEHSTCVSVYFPQISPRTQRSFGEQLRSKCVRLDTELLKKVC